MSAPSLNTPSLKFAIADKHSAQAHEIESPRRSRKHRAAPQPTSGFLRLRNPRVALGESVFSLRRSAPGVLVCNAYQPCQRDRQGATIGRRNQTAVQFGAALTEPFEASVCRASWAAITRRARSQLGSRQLSSGSRVAFDTSDCSRRAKAWCGRRGPNAVACAPGIKHARSGRARRKRFGRHAHATALRTVAALSATGGRRLLAARRARGATIKTTSRLAADGARREQRYDRYKLQHLHDTSPCKFVPSASSR
jgi:hypothetical protein